MSTRKHPNIIKKIKTNMLESLLQLNCKWNYCDQKQEIISNHLKSIKTIRKKQDQKPALKWTHFKQNKCTFSIQVNIKQNNIDEMQWDLI